VDQWQIVSAPYGPPSFQTVDWIAVAVIAFVLVMVGVLLTIHDRRRAHLVA